MIRKFLIVVLLICTVHAAALAQLYIGPATDMLIKANTLICTDSLVLQPAADLTLSNVSITHNYIPVFINGKNSIARVYQFSQPVSFTGSMGLYYGVPELNGNAANALEMAYYSQSAWTVATGSTVNASTQSVTKGVGAPTPLSSITAIDLSVPLPLRVLDFEARKEDLNAALSWTATSDAGNYFLVEHSVDGRSFQSLQRIAAEGTGNRQERYHALHLNPESGIHYYRIKAVDGNGNGSYSAIRSLRFDDNATIILAPNPADGQVWLTGAQPGATMRIFDVAGRLMMTQEMPAGSAQINISGFMPGAYLCRVSTPGAGILMLPFTKR